MKYWLQFLLCLALLPSPYGHATVQVGSWVDLQAQTQALVQAGMQYTLPIRLREDAIFRIAITAPRGAAQHACPTAWSLGDWSTQQWQRIHIPVRCGSQRGSVVAQAHAEVVVYATRQALAQGHHLRSDDLGATRQWIQHAAAALSPEDWLGMQLRQPLAAGQALTRSDLVKPLYAKKGQLLEIRAGDGDIMASTSGIALTKGFKGDVIRARNVRSQAWVEGVLIAPGVLQAQKLQPGHGVKVQASD